MAKVFGFSTSLIVQWLARHIVELIVARDESSKAFVKNQSQIVITVQQNMLPLKLKDGQELNLSRFSADSDIDREIRQAFELFVDCCSLNQFFGQTGPVTFGSHIYLEFLFSAAVAADKVGRDEGEQILNALCEVVPKLRPSQSVVGLEDSLRYIEQLFSIRWVREWLGMRPVPQPPRPNVMNAQKQPLQQGAVGGRGNCGNLTMHDLGAPVANNGIKDNFMGPRVAFNFKQ